MSKIMVTLKKVLAFMIQLILGVYRNVDRVSTLLNLVLHDAVFEGKSLNLFTS